MARRFHLPKGHPGYIGIKGLPKEQHQPGYPGLRNNIVRFREHIHQAYETVQNVQRRAELWKGDEITTKILRAQNEYLRDYWRVLEKQLWPEAFLEEVMMPEPQKEKKKTHKKRRGTLKQSLSEVKRELEVLKEEMSETGEPETMERTSPADKPVELEHVAYKGNSQITLYKTVKSGETTTEEEVKLPEGNQLAEDFPKHISITPQVSQVTYDF